jgi:hypothetical protein
VQGTCNEQVVGSIPTGGSRPALGMARGAEREGEPYFRIAADLRSVITCGALRPGDRLTPVTNLGAL